MARRRPRFAAALAAHAAEQVGQDRASVRVDRPRFLGRGVDYAAFLLDLEQRQPDGTWAWRQVVARVPHRTMSAVEEAQARREARLLARLGEQRLPFRVPEVLAHVELQGRLVMVQSACHGAPLPKRASGDLEPWSVIAPAAAAIHRIDIAGWDAETIGPRMTRREHVEAWRAEVARDAPPAFDDALAFVDEHLPADEPGVLLHSDLLPQNLRIDVMEGDPPAVLDWSYAKMGDPAHDLAIVTRGVRRPFGIEGGTRRLLDAYNEQAAHPVTPGALRVHELLLHMGYYADMPDDLANEARRAQEVKIVGDLLRRSLD